MKMKSLKQSFGQVMVLLVVFSLIFPVHTWAKKVKRGAQIVVTKTDGNMVEGELLSVKQDSILLLTQSGTTGNEINVNEIQTINIKKRSRFFQGIGKGFLIGALSGALLGIVNGDDKEGFLAFTAPQKALFWGLGLGLGGIIVGGIAGAISGTDITINLEGESSEEVNSILKKLNKYARFKD